MANSKKDIDAGNVERQVFDVEKVDSPRGAAKNSPEDTLNKGGWKGGIMGGLLGIGRFVGTGGDTKQSQGFDYITDVRQDLGNERRDEETHMADQLVKYAGLQEKIMELDQAGKDAQVATITNKTNLAVEKLSAQRAEKLLEYAPAFIQGDINTTLTALKKTFGDAQDEDRNFFRENANSPLLNTLEGYEKYHKQMTDQGMDPSKYGMPSPKNWSPEVGNYTKVLGQMSRASVSAKTALTSQQAKDSQELKVAAMNNDADILQLEMQVKGAQETARLKAIADAIQAQAKEAQSNNVNVSPSMLGKPSTYEDVIADVTTTYNKDLTALAERVDEENLSLITSYIQDVASQLMSQSIVTFNNSNGGKVLDWQQAKKQAIKYSLARTTQDGEFFPTGNPEKLQKSRKEFTERMVYKPEVAAEIKRLSDHPVEEEAAKNIRRFLEGLWTDPEARGGAKGTDVYKGTPESETVAKVKFRGMTPHDRPDY
jgi:hypothetical protein